MPNAGPVRVFGLTIGLVCLPLLSAAQDANSSSGQLPVKPPPVPTGVIPLPQGPPPTGRQAPVPSPAKPLPKADRPLGVSPDLRSIDKFIDGHPVTLEEAVAIALYASRDFARAVASLQQSEGRAGQARTALYPTLTGSGDLTYYDQATTVNPSQFGGSSGTGSGSAPPPSIVVTPQFNPIMTATLALPLDVFGALRAAASQAQFQEVASRIDVNRVRNEVVYSVKAAFYEVLRAQSQIAVATDSLNDALIRLNAAEKTYAAGTSPRFDVISAQRDVANAQQNVIDARAQLSVDMAALKSTIGIDVQSHLRISDEKAIEYPPGVLPPLVPPATEGAPKNEANPFNPPAAAAPLITPPPAAAADIPPVPSVPGGQPGISATPGVVEDTFVFGPEFDSLLEEALRTRPEILEYDAQIAAAQRGIQYARRSELPSFNISLNDVYTPNATFFTRENVRFVDLSFSIPIYDGGLAGQRVKEAKGILASQQLGRRQSLDQVKVDVQNAYIALVQARSRVAVANVGLSQAREAFRQARVRYSAGVSQQQNVSPQIELSNAQSALALAESNQVNAIYDYNTARAQLDRAVGRFSFTAATPGYPSPPPDAVRGIKH